MNAKAVVFDFNGTLYFDFYENEEAWVETSLYFSKDGNIPPFNLFAGMTDSACSLLIKPEASKDEVEKMIEYKETKYKEICKRKNLDIEKDARAFIERLNKDHIITAIGSSAPKMNFDWYIPSYDLLSLFKRENMFYGKEELPSKPAPDLYNLVLNSIGVKPEEAICFEDALNGIKAAKSAGFKKVYGIKSPGINLEETGSLVPLVSWDEVVKNYNEIISL